jgi:nucleoside-triphosphatase THEP1
VNESKNTMSVRSPVFIVTGDIAEGKTRFVERLISRLQALDVRLGGFYSPRIMDGVNTTGYDLVGLRTRERIPFLRENQDRDRADIGRFSVVGNAFLVAGQWLEEDGYCGARLIVIDEVGKWEMRGKGWAESLEKQLLHRVTGLVLVVRRAFVDDVVRHWDLKPVTVFDIARIGPEMAGGLILHKLKEHDII